ncbi:hypothetical protein PC9H_003770 [Pleurotus ostreatus]|uniref:F-box domain-containing protein n=1 Tax=Pleurotus ostreatus TaxID=5322 RepID=A0A8H7A345_PLEOS|nr:uncharacterized protein PC9H_003770 [Pleurotus ostreatus]KAF7436936.1 hypothetical protein PC9H_003770 [Pleurotus ostreatus]
MIVSYPSHLEDTMVAKLPVELIHIIITFVSSDHDRHKTLAACSLVCRGWDDICRVHIFDRIIIGNKNLAPRLSFLCHTASHLSEHIRDLSISWDNRNCLASDWNSESFVPFKNLRTLCLANGIARGLTDGPPSPFSVTASLLAAPCLKDLTFRAWTFANVSSLYRMLVLCSNTLEQLSFDGVSFLYSQPSSEFIAPLPIRMGALRSMKFPPKYTPIIECPNLESLSIRVEVGEVWVLPSWVPSGLRDLTLYGTYYYQGCINRLPFPDHLRHLTIDVQKFLFGSEVRYPQTADHEGLSQVLQQLRRRAALERIDLKVTITIEDGAEIHATSDWTDDKAREVANFKLGLGPLLEEKVLHVAFALHRWFDDSEEVEVLMGWDVRTAD